MAASGFEKPADYYANARTDILPVLPDACGRVLEIGCGAGNTLEFLKNEGRADWVGGVEPDPGAAAAAGGRVDFLWQGQVEAHLAADDGIVGAGPFDTILCLDVLEHLIDPWSVTRQLTGLLRPGGRLVACLPNIRFYKVALPLLLRGEWEYTESGILDSTHLRFFTRRTAVELLERAGLQVTEVLPTAPMKPWRNKWILNKLSGGRLLDLYSYNFILRGEKPA